MSFVLAHSVVTAAPTWRCSYPSFPKKKLRHSKIKWLAQDPAAQSFHCLAKPSATSGPIFKRQQL